MVLCVSGCGNGEKVDSNKEFSADDISKMVMDIGKHTPCFRRSSNGILSFTKSKIVRCM